MSNAVSAISNRAATSRASPDSSQMEALQKQVSTLQKELAATQHAGDQKTAAAMSDSISQRISAVQSQIAALQGGGDSTSGGASQSQRDATALQSARQTGMSTGVHINLHV